MIKSLCIKLFSCLSRILTDWQNRQLICFPAKALFQPLPWVSIFGHSTLKLTKLQLRYKKKWIITGRAMRHNSAEINMQSFSFQNVTAVVWKSELAKIELLEDLLTWAELGNYSTINNYQHTNCDFSGCPITVALVIQAGQRNKLQIANLLDNSNL